MRPSTYPELVRRGFYESCEDRLALTADPVELFSPDDLLGGSVEHHAMLEQPISHHSELDPPISHHGDLGGRLVQHGDLGGSVVHHSELDGNDQQISQHLSDSHVQTGLAGVRETYGFRGGGQTAVVIDSGIAYEHENLGGGFGSGYRVVGGLYRRERR